MIDKFNNLIERIRKFREKTKYPIFWEINLFFLLLVLVNLLIFRNDPGFHKLQALFLNPFMLLLLFVVMRYGSNWGYYTAIISGIYILLIPPYNMEKFFSHFPFISGLFIIILFFGPLHENYSKKIKELNDEKNELDGRYRELNERYEINIFLKDNYERKILTQTSTMTDLYQDAINMQILELEELYNEIPGILAKYVEAEKISLYILDGNTLNLKSCYGYYDYEEKPKSRIDMRDAPYNIVFERKELISINLEQFKDTIMADLPVYMAPLKNSDNEVIGLLNVNNISFLKFNNVTRRIVHLISDWCSKAIENAFFYKKAEGRRIIKPETLLFKYEYFLMRLEEALITSRNTNIDYMVLLVKLCNWDNVPENKKLSVLKFVSRILHQHIADFDILAHFEREYEFAVIKVKLPDDNVKTFIYNVQKQMNLYSLKPFENGEVLRLDISYISSISQKKNIEEIINELRNNMESEK